MKVSKTFTVPQRGVGKPDYSQEVALGRTRPGLTLKYRQDLKIAGITFSAIASAYPWVKGLLGAGLTEHLIDWETGIALPYTCEAGYVYSIVSISHSTDQDHVLRAYFSTPALGIALNLAGNLGLITGGEPFWAADVVSFSTAMFDPTAVYEHEVDFIIENLGATDLQGSCTVTNTKEAIGTEPPPTTKTVKCKWCGYEWVVPRETTYIKCPNCGELNIYCDFSRFRSIG